MHSYKPARSRAALGKAENRIGVGGGGWGGGESAVADGLAVELV